MNHRTVRIIAALAVLLPAAAWGAAALNSFRLSAHHPFKGGYVLTDDASPALNTPVTPDPSHNYNFSLNLNTVTRIATGRYKVEFPTLGHRPGASTNFGGNVQVTALYEGLPIYCTTSGWESFFDDPLVSVYVSCIDTTTGALTDAKFSVLAPF